MATIIIATKEKVNNSHDAQEDNCIEEHVMSKSVIFTIVVHNNLLFLAVLVLIDYSAFMIAYLTITDQ
ncbi:hypothetical protein FC35_GL001120 [Limosilactobacillus coleohominis DSM 14060]|nr:hypothetical protein FC35_GL001120 [Limosilactobacillus coleohominis DSM 14060]